MARMPLKGIIVLDFGWVLAGPHGTRLLSDLGATVIKMEWIKRMDMFRMAPLRPGTKDPANEPAWQFQDQNRGKMSFCLNPKTVNGKDILCNIIKKADAVTANLSPDGFRKLGLDYEVLCKIKEDIIVVNASGLGNTGPYRTYLTFAPIMHAFSGLMSMLGYEGEGPWGISGIPSDVIGGANMAIAILAALEYRRRTGKGQFIDISSVDTTLCLLGTEFIDYDINGVIRKPFGNRHYTGQMAPHGCYPCDGDEGWCVIAVGSEYEWERFKTALRSECPWVDDSKFTTLDSRIANQEELDDKIGSWTKSQNKKDVVLRLQNAGVSAGMVQNVAETQADEHAAAAGYFKTVDFGESDNPLRYVKVTGNLTGADLPAGEGIQSAPAIGKDNDYILRQLLGMTDQQIQAAKEDGALI